MTPTELTALAREKFQWQALPLMLLRLAAIGGAAGALSWGVVGRQGVAAAVLGALLGAIGGHIAALTRTRLPILLAGALAIGVTSGVIGYLAVANVSMVRMLGPSLALDVSEMARFGGYAMAVAAALRILSTRIPSFVGAELVVIAGAVVLPLAPHREGVVARPLWLSDWAWHNGYDPQHVLLAIGGVVALVLGGLLMARRGNKVSLISWLTLAGLLLLGVSILDVGGLPEPQAGNDLGLTGDEQGDPPLPTDDGPWQGPGKSHNDKNHPGGQGEGGGQPKDSGDDGGQGQQDDGGQGQGEQNGQDGGQSQQGQEQDSQGQGGQSEQQGQGQGQGQRQGQGNQQKQDKGKGQGGGKPPPSEPDLDDASGGGSPAPMAVVLFGDDYDPPSGGYYFRQDVWSHFNGSRLVASRRADADRDVLKSFPAASREVADIPPETGRQPVNAQVFLTVKHTRPFALESLVKMKPVKNPDSQRFVRAYEFDSLSQTIDYQALLGKQVGSSAWTPDVFEYYTVAPSDERYEELATKIVSELPDDVRDDPFAQALAIKLWLDENITYSTSERHAGAADPAADFLFGNKIGYCVHIAHAAVYLWRTRGITARVGTGYYAPTDNRRGSALILRGSDAHAWPELYLDGVGWIVLDISPQKTLDEPGEPADDELTEQLADIARQESDEQGERSESKRDPTKKGMALPLQLLIWLAGALIVLYAIKLWRRLAPYFTPGRRMHKVAYRRALDQLAEVGRVRQYGETRTQFARRVADIAPSMHALAVMSEAARLGWPTDPRLRPELQLAPWKQGLAALSKDLSKHVPVGRRIFGLLNPIAFWQVR